MMARNNWDDEPLDADALMQQLGGEPPVAGDKIDFGGVIPNTGNQGQIGHITRGGTVPLGPLMGPDDAPTSNTMPVGGTPTTPRPPAPADPRSANAPRISRSDTGGYTLKEHGNQRNLQANEVGDATKYVNDFWTANPIGFQAGNANSMNDAYRQFTGRDGDAAGLAAHAKNPGGFEGAINAIANSDEAKAYANRPQTILGGTTTTPPAGGAFTRENRDALKYGNVGRMEGFNTSDYGGDVKARNSVKNTFGRIASRYANAPNSVEAMMADPDFKSAFPNAKRVAGGAGDKIDFGGVLSDFETGSPVGVVDVLTASDPRNNTANGWAWMPDGEGGTQTQGGGPAAPQANAGPRIDNGAIGRPAPVDAPAQAPTENADPMAAVMAEIQALQNGGGSPMEQDALLQLLGAV
jgi:hypothetical protein